MIPPANPPDDERVLETLRAVREHFPHECPVGVILGTGFADVVNILQVEQRFAYNDLPHMSPTSAVGHVGELVCGHTQGRAVVMLRGRIHLYEGHSPDQIEFVMRVLASLGVRTLVVTNASGGLNPVYRCGDLVAIESQVDLTFRPAGLQPPSDLKAMRHLASSPLYCPTLVERVEQIGRKLQAKVHRGTYVGVMGPNYETRAEYRFLRRIADIVGMSTVHEVRAAHSLGMRVAGLSVVTNECQPDQLHATSGEAVVNAGEQAAETLGQVVASLIQCPKT